MIRDHAEKNLKKSGEVLATEVEATGDSQLDQEAVAKAQREAERKLERAAAQRMVHAIAHQAPYPTTARTEREIAAQALGLSSLARLAFFLG